MLKLDERDLQILSVLQREGRLSKTELASRINLSVSPCWERLKRLEEFGIIEGYEARISMKAFGTLTTVFMLGELSQHKAQDFTQFEKAINDIPEIVECWALGGGYDYLLKFVCSSIDAYQKLVERILDQEVGMTRYYTYVVTKPIKLQPAPPLFVLEPLIKESSAT